MVGNLFRYTGLEGRFRLSPVLYDYGTDLVFTDRDVEIGTDYCKVKDEVLFGFVKEGSIMHRNNLWGEEASWM
jgi:hypothetical protein